MTAAVEETDYLVGLRDGAWLDLQVFPALRYAVPPLLPEGFTLLVGPPKIGKTWFIQATALAVAAGGRMLGIHVGEPRPVLLLALEDGDRRLQDRCRVLLGPDPIPHRLNYMTRILPGRVIDTIGSWLEIYGDRSPLVIVDTLGRVMPPALMGESSYQRDYRVGAALKRAIDEHPGASLVVNHHDRKATSDDFVDAVSGTHGLAGAADTIVVLARQRTEETGLLKVTGRDVIEAEYAVGFRDGLWSLDGDDLADAAAQAMAVRATANLGDDAARIVRFVTEHGQVRPAAVAQLLGVDAKRAGTYLGRLADSGRIRRIERGLYGPTPT